MNDENDENEYTPRNYRKRPVVVTAVRMRDDFRVATLGGTMSGSAGDWLITGVEGEHYPCADHIFRKTYEPDDGRASGDTPEARNRARRRGYRDRSIDGEINPSARAQERYSDVPCSRCDDPEQGLPHLADSRAEFYWHHQHEGSHSHRSGCPRYGYSEHCGAEPKPGTATSLFERCLHDMVERSESEYLAAKRAVEEDGADDARIRMGLT